MAKKQFIRHLEYYGFPDQNTYASEINGVDLSDIREKNKEQDKEIQDLEGEKADKKDLVELSSTVDSLIETQSEINLEFADTISGISEDVETLKRIDDEFAEQFSAVTSGLDETMDALETLTSRVDAAESSITNINESIETIINGYAKKDDVYSKEEIDEMISTGFSGYATQEWVEEQGYITEEEADARYAKIGDLEDLANQVESATTSISERLDEIDASINDINIKVDELNTFSGDVSGALAAINTTIDDIGDDIVRIDVATSANTDAINANTSAISENTEAIGTLQGAVNSITSDIETISAQVETNTSDIVSKADKDAVIAMRGELLGMIEGLENEKADKASLDVVSGTVITLNENLSNEITERIEGDRTINEAVATLNGRITTAEQKVDICVAKVDNIESGLTKEIGDRQAADLALIGDDGDTSDDDTIWGAKKLAAALSADAVVQSKNYTNTLVDTFETELAELSAKTDQELSKFATREYVNSGIANAKTTLRSDIANGDNAEKNERIAADVALGEEITTIKENLLEEVAVIDKNSTILNAFTDWNGEGEYDDSGNGIVDVMHREIHDLNPEGIEEIKAQVNTNTANIETNTEAIATKADADTVYTKDEVDAALAIKADAENVFTKEEVDVLLLEKENEIYNLTKIVGDMGGAVTYEYPNAAGKSLTTLLGNNGTVKLTEDATITRFGPGISAKNKVTLNLNGKSLTSTAAGDNGAIMSRGTQEITITGNTATTIDAINGICIEANGATSVINLNGKTTYVTDRSGGELIYCYAGTINIKDGTFKNLGEDKKYLLNCYDANYQNGSAKIIVTGGKFYDFNPADNTAEGEHTSFVPAGYHVEESQDGDSTVYTVKKDA